MTMAFWKFMTRELVSMQPIACERRSRGVLTEATMMWLMGALCDRNIVCFLMKMIRAIPTITLGSGHTLDANAMKTNHAFVRKFTHSSLPEHASHLGITLFMTTRLARMPLKAWDKSLIGVLTEATKTWSTAVQFVRMARCSETTKAFVIPNTVLEAGHTPDANALNNSHVCAPRLNLRLQSVQQCRLRRDSAIPTATRKNVAKMAAPGKIASASIGLLLLWAAPVMRIISKGNAREEDVCGRKENAASPNALTLASALDVFMTTTRKPPVTRVIYLKHSLPT